MQTDKFAHPWAAECVAAAEHIRNRFGVGPTLDYLVGEKALLVLSHSERDNTYVIDLIEVVAAARRILLPDEIASHLRQKSRSGDAHTRARLRRLRELLSRPPA